MTKLYFKWLLVIICFHLRHPCLGQNHSPTLLMLSPNNQPDLSTTFTQMSPSSISLKNYDHDQMTAFIGQSDSNDLMPSKENSDSKTSMAIAPVIVNKCCERFEVIINSYCLKANVSDYQPTFSSNGNLNSPAQDGIKYSFRIGTPACGTKQMWPIYDYEGSNDKLILLADGTLRHYVKVISDKEDNHWNKINDPEEISDEEKWLSIDYQHNQYCIERFSFHKNNSTGLKIFANICHNKRQIMWTEPDFLIRKVLNPICHIIALIIFLIVAVVYFILPTLRDLVGNIITTISVCLIISQIASLVRMFTEFSSHISFIAADMVLYISLLATFIWLNCFGYYIWKTFRSRNVFLRVTDGRKYCYYSSFAWGFTFLLGITAIFAHFFLDTDSYKEPNLTVEQETISWLGISIFFAPIACSILIDIFFYVTTVKLINRRNVYGRIQHKLKANFTMFSLMLLIISIDWIFFCLSWLQLDGLVYVHIIVNALQAPFLLYVCVLRQKHVKFLLRKTCCYNEPPSVNDWGDELHNMNSNS